MKILVLGGEGMLGHKVFQTLIGRYSDTTCTVRGSLEEEFYRRIDPFRQGRAIERANAMDLPAFERMLRAESPEFTVNCIGVIKQRWEANAAIPGITLNLLFPQKLAEIAADWGGG